MPTIDNWRALREALAAGMTTAELVSAGYAGYIRSLLDERDRLAAEVEALRAEVAAETERCASLCDGIGAGYTGEARRLSGQYATHAAGQRDGANECAAAIRAVGVYAAMKGKP